MGRSLIPFAPYSEKTIAVGTAGAALAGAGAGEGCASAAGAAMTNARTAIRFIIHSPHQHRPEMPPPVLHGCFLDR